LIVLVTVFFEDLDATVTFTTQVPVFTATIFPDFTLQNFAEEPGTLTVTFAPGGTLRFAVFAMLENVAGLSAVSSVTFPESSNGAGEAAGAAGAIGNGAT
jgi:hypothetical protein